MNRHLSLPSNNQSTQDEPVNQQRAFAVSFVRQAWGNTSLSLKMGLLSALLIVGMFGIAVGAYVGIQNLQYQLSNIYDFMLVPIVAINQADTALADAELYILQSQGQDFSGTVRVSELQNASASNQTAKEVIDRYNNEWVTTVSPDFTRDLRNAGMLNLQQQEVDTLQRLNSSFTAYQAAFNRYLTSVKSGTANPEVANQAIASIRQARSYLQKLIEINSQYAEFSNTTARTVTKQVAINNVIVLVIGIIISILASYFIIVSITGRLNELTRSATAMQSGDLNQRVTVTGRDEVSLLGSVFNNMASRLRELFETLEQRVAARTRNLELAAEVGRTVSQVRELNVMLKDACELILKEFDLYYVQVYLTNPSQTALQLEAGTGTVGAQLLARGHNLPFDANSINGRAAVDQHTVVIADTSQSLTFRKNPLLPETRGEMAVPLIVANKVVGVLDMQSAKAEVLTEEVRPAFEALAGQLAVAIQNSNLLTEAEQARAEVEKQARHLVRTGWNEHLDAIHKPEQIGFVFDHNEIISLADRTESQFAEDEKAVTVPISVTGEPLGSLVVELDDETQSNQTNELVNIVAHQIAQQIENIRLLESAERYRYEAEQAARRQTVEGWQEYMASKSTESLGYLYDTNEVLPQSYQVEDTFEFALPLKARDERIGKLGVQGLNNDDREAIELVGAVAERLSDHIENLRLLEETRLGQIELDQRARQLAAVAEIATISSREFDIEKMLESVVHLTQRKFGLYHCHVFLYNEQKNILKIAACGWKEGDIHEGTHGAAAISLDQEQSLVARAARTEKAVIVNDVHNEPGWLPNPLLPDTAAELAVPLLVGNRLLGVLDVQSDHMDAFTDEDANIQTTLASQVATALQNAYSFNQAQSALAQSEKLFNTSRRFTQTTDLQELVKATVESLDIANIDRAILGSLNYDAAGELDSMNIVANWSSDSGLQATPIGTHYPKEALKATTLFTSPVPLFFDDMLNDERIDEVMKEIPRKLRYRAVAALPLFAGARQDAMLLLEGENPHHFTQEEIRLFSALAPQLATIMENLRLYNQTQSALTQSEKLFDASRRLTQATDLQHLVAETVALMNIPEVNRALLTTFDYDQNGDVDQLTIMANWWNSTGHEITPIGTRYPREVIRVMTMFISPVPVFFNDAFTDERVDTTTMQLVKRLNLRAVAVLPLHLGAQQIGALILEAEDAHNFTQEEIRLFSALAPQIATVVENKRQFEKAQRQAERESMLNAIGQKIQSATTVEAVLQIAARELGRALSAPLTVAQLGMSTKNNGHNGN